MSPGTARPARAIADMVPMAVLTLIAKIAVGGSLSARRASAAVSPDSMLKLEGTINLGSFSIPASSIAWRYPDRRPSELVA
jgi:uncharacterized membrane protein YfbV (UPF0208 family)